jgi:hypothetical protein
VEDWKKSERRYWRVETRMEKEVTLVVCQVDFGILIFKALGCT